MSDLVDTLVGLAPGDTLDGFRRAREDARTHTQASEVALLDADTNGVPRPDRALVAAFVAGLTDPGSRAALHRREALDAQRRVVLDALVDSAAQTGPWGTYREPGLSSESRPRPAWSVPALLGEQLGRPLCAVLEHAHLLVFHPRDARPDALVSLAAAGWDRAAIVTWSQLVSYVSYQARLVSGLRVLHTTTTGSDHD